MMMTIHWLLVVNAVLATANVVLWFVVMVRMRSTLQEKSATHAEEVRRFTAQSTKYCSDREEWEGTLLAKNAEIESLQIKLKEAGVKPVEQQEDAMAIISAVHPNGQPVATCNIGGVPVPVTFAKQMLKPFTLTKEQAAQLDEIIHHGKPRVTCNMGDCVDRSMKPPQPSDDSSPHMPLKKGPTVEVRFSEPTPLRPSRTRDDEAND